MSDSQHEKHSFQAEVSRLLHMMINSVYSEREIFLRELISNASDACDKLRYLAVTEPKLTADNPEFRIDLILDPQARTLTVSDNGVGMAHDELIENLGTIAHSGTGAFVDRLTGDSSKDVNLIGQFGVGFYSGFMVAGHIAVTSRRAGEGVAWCWTSEGTGEFELAPAEKATRGTDICLFMREGDDEFLDADRLRKLVTAYSDHVDHPIYFHIAGQDEDEADRKPINTGSALWTRSKSDITEDQYKEFYQATGHMFDDPWLTLHYRAEGKIEFTVLLFIPTMRPMDLFDPARQNRLRLYVKRVFITDEAELLPPWMRFVRGIVDSEDMPLNISREMLQNNPVVSRIRNALTNRLLNELKKKAEQDPDGYTTFWRNFGAVLKEGLYEDAGRRDDLLKLSRFTTTKSGEGMRSLDEYLADMGDNQTVIYYITGENADSVRRSPQLEGFLARDIEVLLLSDPVDDFWLTAQQGFEGKPFKSVTQGEADLADMPKSEDNGGGDDDKPLEGDLSVLIALCKQALEDEVSDVRPSNRLTNSAVCLVASEMGVDMNLERILASQNPDTNIPRLPRILELNPTHPLVKLLSDKAKAGGHAAELEDAAHLLLDQARLLEGESLPDPVAFAARMSDLIRQALSAR